MPQSSLTSWLKGSAYGEKAHDKKAERGGNMLPLSTPTQHKPAPPPRTTSAPSRVQSTTAVAAPATDNWNDIPDDFLQVLSKPRSKKSPRSSRATTPAGTPGISTPTAAAIVRQNSIPPSFALRPLPSNVELGPLTVEHLPAFKRLNALLLPIAYPESFYRETMTEQYLSVTVIALWKTAHTQDGSTEFRAEQSLLVGGIRCRVLPSFQLYISTIGVLAPYRSHGIALHLLQSVVRKAVELHSVRFIVAHVWEANDEGLAWYKKRNFEILDKEDSYYKKLKPHGAYLVRKAIGVGDLLGT